MKNRIIKRMGSGWMLTAMLLCSCACSHNSDIYLEEYEENTLASQMVSTQEVISTQENTDCLETLEQETEETDCYVYICGAVEEPGVYMLPLESRIFEVIQKAGGLTAEADETLVNQAEYITDGMMIRIYTKEEAQMMGQVGAKVSSVGTMEDGKVDINTADVAELMTLPGVGASKANAIVSYREENGGFSSIEDLMKIPGIKEGIFNQMKEHIKVNK